MTSPEIPELITAKTSALYRRANERLDTVINGLRADIAEHAMCDTAPPECIGWLLTHQWVKAGLESGQLTQGFVTELLTTAMYRVAKS